MAELSKTRSKKQEWPYPVILQTIEGPVIGWNRKMGNTILKSGWREKNRQLYYLVPLPAYRKQKR